MVTCTTCGTISTTHERFSELMLTFPQPHHESDQDCTVEDLITHHCGTQDIEDYQCSCCNDRKLAKKVTSITTCPPILCIVLCRRKLDGGSIKSAVQFHVSGFNIRKDDLQYNLVGTVHHSPSRPDQGHYMSICKSKRSQLRNWFNYNDREVSFSHFTNKRNDKVLKGHIKTATILFYVSGALQTCIRSRSPIVDLQDDTTSYSSPVNDEDGTGEGGGKMMLHHPCHLKVSQIIAFHKRFYNELKAIIAIYDVSNTT
jgi:hypothetical protein